MDGSLASAPVRTTCPYCGVGCGLTVSNAGGGKAVVAGDPSHPANFGRLCSKGAALGETLSLDGRLLHPEIRGRRMDWPTALDAVAQGFARTIAEHGPDAVAFYVSGQLLTEDYYVANKLAKGFLGTGNIDTNSRLCMASSVAGHRRAFGADIVPGSYQDFDLADLVVLVGSNLAWCHPVLFQRLAQARRARPRLTVVTIDPRRTSTAEESDLHIALRPGSDAVLFNGLLAYLAKSGHRAASFVDRHTAGEREAVIAAGTAGSAAEVARACGVTTAIIERFYALFAERARAVTVYSQGINQSASGTDKVNAIINCHLFTGRIGRPGMGPFSVTGQPNAMGGREVGALANQLAAHMDFSAVDCDRVRRFWQAPNLATRPGLKAVDLFRTVGEGRIKAIWIMATNPAVSLPDAGAVKAALSACPLVVVSDGVRATETGDLADILLPASLWGERNGTVTNSERRISRQRPFQPAPGEARPDWWILSEVAKRLGHGRAFAYRSPADIFREHAALSGFENDGARGFDIGALAAIDDAAYDALQPVQWPFPARAGRSRERLFADGGFFTPDKRAGFVPVAPRAPAYPADAEFPLVLNTGRVRDQWHTMTRTAIPRLMVHTPEPFLAIHPLDAAAAGLADGGLARVESRWGAGVFRVRPDDGQRRGEVFVPMHWSGPFASDSAVNRAVNPAVDPVSGQPELKHTPVRARPFAADWHAVAVARRRLDISAFPYGVVVAGEGSWRHELAGTGPARAASTLLAGMLADGVSPTVEFHDPVGGRNRAAWFSNGRIEACLFVGDADELRSRTWLGQLFLAGHLAEADRAALLSGRASGASVASGPVVCACYGVCRDEIEKAAAGGAGTVEAVGVALKAGTNCGSCVPELRKILAVRPREVA